MPLNLSFNSFKFLAAFWRVPRPGTPSHRQYQAHKNNITHIPIPIEESPIFAFHQKHLRLSNIHLAQYGHQNRLTFFEYGSLLQ